MNGVCFELTKKQTELLNDLFTQNEIANDKGVIVGQFFDSADGIGFCRIGFVDNKKAAALQKALGVKVGEMSPEEFSVFCTGD